MNPKEVIKNLPFWLLMFVATIAGVVGVCWLVWQGMQQVSPNGARLWALLVTVLLPLTAVVSWWFGHTEARGRLKGIDDAVDTMLGAVVKTARVKTSVQQEMQKPEEVSLPEIHRRSLPDNDKVIEV